MVMTASDPDQIPSIRDDLAYQISAIHITSMWCVGGYYTHLNYPINTITTENLMDADKG
ncbi:hypothetical protein PS723_06284 [Pseudomonas fluorescens]|uniref:Uncharacterized protein n=1 Tax=Pseudomonas fluorescens TaxID=294 RepID=A0A5E7FXE3_PSEFL|nr:hypothetical protein PS723_06284 [Pseudomonas fluorescens]